jgi:hypothetical protein
MISKFGAWTWLIVILLITNYFGWTAIPWMLLKIVACTTVCVWAWAIIVATIIVIMNSKK